MADEKNSGAGFERFIKWTFISICTIITVVVGIVCGIIAANVRDLPAIDKLHQYEPDKVARLYSSDDRLFAEFFIKRRIIVPLDQIPKPLIDAFISVEDNRFYKHFGIDIEGIARALFSNLFAGKIKEGGSTITQQLAKVLFLSPEKTFNRKIKEALIAFQIEREFTKDEILHLYLNQLYFGSGAYGVEAAALVYFNKHVKDLSIEECAMLAGLPKAPTLYSPYNNMGYAMKRRNLVLDRMYDERFITKEMREKLKAMPIKLKSGVPENSEAPYLSEYIRSYVEKTYGTKLLFKGGFKIKTTLDIDMQETAVKALNRGLMDYARNKYFKKVPPEKVETLLPIFEDLTSLQPDTLYYGKVKELRGQNVIVSIGKTEGFIPPDECKWAHIDTPSFVFRVGDIIAVSFKEVSKDGQNIFSLENYSEVDGAVIAIEPSTGQIKAMVGGKNFRINQFNRAVQAKRQPGSSFKPFIYATAIESRKYNPLTRILDAPFSVRLPNGEMWSPQNYDGKFKGPITLQHALEESRNLVTIRLLKQIGPDAVIEQAKKMGIKSPLDANLSLALGSSALSLIEITSAYTVFPNEGIRIEPNAITSIENDNGSILEQPVPRKEVSLSPETAYTMANLLQYVVKRGTGTKAAMPNIPVAGKTGTTNDFKDAWFIGFTPDIAIGVFVGYDDNSKTLGNKQTGGLIAAPIWKYVAENYYKNRTPTGDYKKPDDVVLINVIPESGPVVAEATDKTIPIAFIKGTEPGKTYFPADKKNTSLREHLRDEGL